MKLPESWRAVRLRDVCEIGSGDGAPQEEQWFCEDGVPFVRVSDLALTRESNRLIKSRDGLTGSAVEQLRLRNWKQNSLLFPKSGASALLNQRALLGMDACVVSHLAIIEPSNAIDPDYLYWWSTQFDAARITLDPGYPSIRLQDLGRVKLPLPTLPEQQHIVDVLRQADAVTRDLQSRRRQLDLMIKAALDRLVLAVDKSEWISLGELVETRYGTSVSADATANTGTPVLRIPNVMGGEVDKADMKYVELPQAELKRLRLFDTDVLIVRSNGNPDYVGRSAPITEEIARFPIVYASYLIRLRTDTERLLPEYLSAFLNSAFGRAAMRNAIRTTAGQSNLSGENLTKVRLPVPTLVEQQQFRKFWLEVKALRQLISKSECAAEDLRYALVTNALSGDLTEDWRLRHHEEIAAAVETRDALLRERGAKFASRPPEPVPLAPAVKDPIRPTRQWLMDELSEFQRQVFKAFSAYSKDTKQPLIVEDADIFSRFCDDDNVVECLKDFGPSLNNRIRRTLSQLSALGLIAKVTLPKQNAETGELEYLKAFRPLREAEFTKMSDVDSLRRVLKPGAEEKYYSLSVHLDYETSERAGAGGMFQVISIEDEDANDLTRLVDQGTHYSSLEVLKQDIATALKVTSQQVDLEEV